MITINVANITKVYQLYDRPIDRLFEALSIKKNLHREHYALNDISFSVSKGEIFGIIGHNGAGKSTLLKIIAGVLTPTSGSCATTGKVSSLLELGAGFNPEYTGIENIYLNGTIIGFSREEMKDKLEKIISFADIGDFIHQPVKNYSSGMFARLAFAVAINVDPDILIIDEALSVGDIFFQAKCFKKFDEFRNAGKTILFVSHDLGSVIRYCNRAMVLSEGKVVSIGPTAKVIDIYKKLTAGHYNTINETSDSASMRQTTEAEVWKTRIMQNPYYSEYGNRDIEIVDFGIFDDNEQISTTINKDSSFSVRMKVRINKAYESPIFAITFKDIKGTDITGTNTLVEAMDTSGLMPGSLYIVTFRQIMNLRGGNFLINLGCTTFVDGEFVVLHRLYDIMNLSVLSDKNVIGFYDIHSSITIEKEVTNS
ncbi:MAG: ABC transporter ATP-binding protein [Clostridiales bacterium]|nr:ABC transporter ATP-binding protein [Clostridiales bacterium]